MLGKDAERLGAAQLSCGSAKRRIYMTDEKNDIRAQVREYYGKTLGSSDDLKTNACCCATERPPKYVLDVMPDIADEKAKELEQKMRKNEFDFDIKYHKINSLFKILLIKKKKTVKTNLCLVKEKEEHREDIDSEEDELEEINE